MSDHVGKNSLHSVGIDRFGGSDCRISGLAWSDFAIYGRVDDLVAFALGCSFTFEHAALRAGIPMWHIEQDTTVPMFRSNIACVQAGRFGGTMVVSMRAVAADQVDLITEISAKYPLAHGSPVHVGDPDKIGIIDLDRPEWGDAAPLAQGQVPVFWACGVTPQVAIENARVPLVVTHKPGCMLITDIDENPLGHFVVGDRGAQAIIPTP